VQQHRRVVEVEPLPPRQLDGLVEQVLRGTRPSANEAAVHRLVHEHERLCHSVVLAKVAEVADVAAQAVQEVLPCDSGACGRG